MAQAPLLDLTPLALVLLGSVALIWRHPAQSQSWEIWGNLAAQFLSHLLTAVTWDPWQAKLARDECGPQSPYLAKILATHCLRTSLITLYGLILLAWTIDIYATPK